MRIRAQSERVKGRERERESRGQEGQRMCVRERQEEGGGGHREKDEGGRLKEKNRTE